VTGGFIPLKLKPLPLGVICEIVRADPPELVSVCETVLVLPVVTFPKLWLVGLAATSPGITPVPDNEIFKVELDALLVKLRFPLTLPLDCGENRTLNDVLCPAFRVRGNVRPLKLMPVPVTFACEIVTLEPPELVKVSMRLFELPVCTLPKPSVAGFGLSVPGGNTPVPVSGTEKLGLDPFEMIERFPLKLPADAGVNFNVKFAL
jgi:hypothetical protein